MKKILVLIFISLALVSCGKTPFDKLSPERKDQITAEFTDTARKYLWSMFSLALTSGVDEKKMEEETEKMKKLITADFEKLKEKHSDVDFSNVLEGSLIRLDNSRTDTENFKVVPKGEFAEFEANNEGVLKMRVSDVVWKWTKIEEDYSVYTANKQFLSIQFEAENIGKKPTFFYLSDGKLITRDGYEYSAQNLLYQMKAPKWYSSCISCEGNPWEKKIDAAVFDIDKIDLAGAKIRFSKIGIDFQL